MHVLMQHPQHPLPSIVSTLSLDYPTFVQLGYKVINQGTKKNMQDAYEEMVGEFCTQLETDNN